MKKLLWAISLFLALPSLGFGQNFSDLVKQLETKNAKGCLCAEGGPCHCGPNCHCLHSVQKTEEPESYKAIYDLAKKGGKDAAIYVGERPVSLVSGIRIVTGHVDQIPGHPEIKGLMIGKRLTKAQKPYLQDGDFVYEVIPADSSVEEVYVSLEKLAVEAAVYVTRQQCAGGNCGGASFAMPAMSFGGFGGGCAGGMCGPMMMGGFGGCGVGGCAGGGCAGGRCR